MNIENNICYGSVLYLSHGGGPLPLLADKAHSELVQTLKSITSVITKPSAIVVVSAHWEAQKVTITNSKSPTLIYDYYGFPEESYQIQYPVPGQPLLAQKIANLLTNQGIEVSLDEQRGFDHGVFVPLKIMYPNADIPCVQVSLLKSLDSLAHIKIGRALAELRKDNVLIIGSGFSFHNLQAFFLPPSNEMRLMNESFEKWLIEACTNPDLSEAEREQRLIYWENAPAARFCHPREEHLLPLHVCYGCAQSFAKQVFTFEVMGKKTSCYLW